MPPASGTKRKRLDRKISHDENPRASPHRPEDLDLAQASQPESPQHSRSDEHKSKHILSRGERVSQQAHHAPSASIMSTQNQSEAVEPAEDDAMSDDVTSTPLSSSFLFEYITDEVVRSWSDQGKEAIKAQLIEATQDDNGATLELLLQEVIESASIRRTSPRGSGLLLKEAIAESLTESGSLLQDAVLSMVSVVFADEDAKPSKKNEEEKPTDPRIGALSEMLIASEIDQEALRTEFDAQLLEQLHLVRETFQRQVIRKQTNVLYRQSNYNLLREETEGFSKLITEMFTTSGNELPHAHVIKATVERVKAMIGAFNLDVGRALDVVLDVFGSVLVKQYRFFVKFLRASPWWPRIEGENDDLDQVSAIGGLPRWALPDVDEWHLSEEQTYDLSQLSITRDAQFWDLARKVGIKAFFQLNQANLTSDVETNDLTDSEWQKETGTAPRMGSREAAQLLGFKLRYYAPGAEGDNPDGTPRNLIYLAALLIKIGFISLHDLYPHLWRPDEEMDKLKEIKTKEKLEKERASRPGGGASNALAMAGALPDDTAPPAPVSRLKEQGTRSSTPAPEAEKVKESTTDRPDQKVLLLQNLLAIGALPEALFIIGRFPWMIDLITELPEYINRILHHCLSQVYNSLRPLQTRPSLHAQQPTYDLDTGSPKGHARLDFAPQRRVLRWPLLDRDDSELDGINYRFYWDEWNDNLPICQTVDDVFTLSETLLPLVGAKIGHDPSLVLKFARIGKASLKEDNSESNRNRWLDLIKRLLLPAISLTKANAGIVNEVYELISIYPTQSRYQMYLEWLSGNVSRTPDMVAARTLADAETKDILRRISKTNVKPMARALAKIAYANPHVVVDRALRQIEVYDSIADVFVEGARFFTDLGYDVLTWSLIMAFAKDDRAGMQADGLFTSRWLSALSHFIGKIYRRYPMMKSAPILQYVQKQLDNGIHIDLVTLEQLISSMAGIPPDTNFNDDQLLAMGGGPLLQSQTMLQLLDQRHTLKTSAKRLMKALQDCGLISKLLIALAKQRRDCIYESADAPLKVVGNTYDEITRVLVQYVDLLRTNLSIGDFGREVPSVNVLLMDYELTAEIAFWIDRPQIHARLQEYNSENPPPLPKGTKDVNGDVKMADQDESSEDGEAEETKSADDATAMETADEKKDTDVVLDEDEIYVDFVLAERWHPVLKNIMDDIDDSLPDDVRDVVGTGFYVTFWHLSLYDIIVPSQSYHEERKRLNKNIKTIKDDRSNVSESQKRAKEAQINQIQKLIEELDQENKEQLKNHNMTRIQLKREKRQWFVGKSHMFAELNKSLMEHCFLPRILLSPSDAYFCAKFLKLLHSFGTPNFRSLGFYDMIFNSNRLASLFFTCTSKESDNLGKFLLEILKDLGKWRASKGTYNSQAFGSKLQLPGFATKVEEGKPQVFLEFDAFKKVVFKWHCQLFAAITKCFSSPEYMHVRNAISVLRTISPVFPFVENHGKALYKAVERLGDSELQDIKVASQALRGALARRQKEWVSAAAFRQDSSISQQPSTTKTDSHKTEVVAEKASTPLESVKKPEIKPKAELSVKREIEKTPSVTSKDGGRSPSRNATPVPARATRDSSSLRPARADSRHDVPRKLSPPPRIASTTLPSRGESDGRNGYRDSRTRPNPYDQSRPDSRTGYPARHPAERIHESSHDASLRYPARPTDRPSMLDRDDRTSRREHDPRQDSRSGYEDRRYAEQNSRPEREIRPERDHRPDREPRHEREHPRSEQRVFERPERVERDHTRGMDSTERRRDDGYSSSRHDTSSRHATPSTSATATSINPQRAALITGTDDSRPSMSIRGSAQQEKPRSSRPTSPRPQEDRRSGVRIDKEERQDRRPESSIRGPPLPPQSVPSRPNPNAPPPRDSRNHNRQAVDLSHGRLEQETSSRTIQRQERPTEAEPPSGPRSRQPNASPRTEPPPARQPQPSRPPTGPGRHVRNNSHATEPTTSSANEAVGIHPDRMNNISAEPTRSPRPQPLQASPPSGPRNNNVPPTGPSASPVTRGPPSGPQAEGGRGQRHPMQAVNTTLAQAASSPRAPAGRGRGGMRQNSVSFNNSVPQSPVNGPPQTFNPQHDNSMQDPNSVPIQPRGPSRSNSQRDDRAPRRGGGQHEDRRPDSSYKDGRGPPTQSHESGQPRSGPRGYPRGPNGNGERDDGPQTRKHGRDESLSAPYGGGRGGRAASEAKRPRRGGG